jgi:hypothetical protein
MNVDYLVTGLSVTTTIVAAFLALYTYFKKSSLEIYSNARRAHLSTRDSYGIYIKRLWTTIEVDSDGGAKITRRYEGIKSLGSSVTTEIPYRYWWHGSARVVSRPSLVVTQPFPRNVTLHIVKESTSGVYCNVGISEGLSSDDPPLSFEVSMSIENLVPLSAGAAKAAFKDDVFPDDYHSADVNVPVSEVVVEAHLPDTVQEKVSLRPVVFLGGTESISSRETERAKEGFWLKNGRGKLTVQSPVVGMKYGVAWKFKY